MNKIELLKVELSKTKYSNLVAAQDYPALTAILNAKPLIANTQARENIFKPLTIIDLWQKITPQEGIEIYKIPGLKPDIDHALNTNNRASLAVLLALVSHIISPESISGIKELMEQTVSDPNYKPQVQGESIAEVLGFSSVGEADVQSALNF